MTPNLEDLRREKLAALKRLDAATAALERGRKLADSTAAAMRKIEAAQSGVREGAAQRLADSLATGAPAISEALLMPAHEGDSALAQARTTAAVAAAALKKLESACVQALGEVTAADRAIVESVDEAMNQEREALAQEAIGLVGQLQSALIKLRRKAPDGMDITPAERASRSALVARALAVRVKERGDDDLNIPVNHLQHLREMPDPVLNAAFDRAAWTARRAALIRAAEEGHAAAA